MSRMSRGRVSRETSPPETRDNGAHVPRREPQVLETLRFREDPPPKIGRDPPSQKYPGPLPPKTGTQTKNLRILSNKRGKARLSASRRGAAWTAGPTTPPHFWKFSGMWGEVPPRPRRHPAAGARDGLALAQNGPKTGRAADDTPRGPARPQRARHGSREARPSRFTSTPLPLKGHGGARPRRASRPHCREPSGSPSAARLRALGIQKTGGSRTPRRAPNGALDLASDLRRGVTRAPDPGVVYPAPGYAPPRDTARRDG